MLLFQPPQYGHTCWNYFISNPVAGNHGNSVFTHKKSGALRYGQHYFKVRRRFFAMNDRDVCAHKAGAAQQVSNLSLRKPEPHISVQFARLVEVVFQQIHHHNTSAGLQDAPGLRHGPLRMYSVMKTLMQQSDIGFALNERQFFHIAQTVLEILNAVAFGDARCVLDHLHGTVYRNHFGRALRKHQGERALPCSQIRYDEGRQQPEKHLR